MDMAMHGKRRGRVDCTINAARMSIFRVWPCSSVAFLFLVIGFAGLSDARAADAKPGIYNPVHEYDTRPVEDRFRHHRLRGGNPWVRKHHLDLLILWLLIIFLLILKHFWYYYGTKF